MANAFAHMELNTGDVSAAKKFYKKIFEGWEMDDQDMGEGMTYTMVREGKRGLGGMTVNSPGVPTSWLPYVEVEDVKKTLAKAEKAGANIVTPYFSIGEMGAIGVFTDPTGAMMGLWEMAKEPSKKDKKAAKQAAKAAKAAEKEAKKAAKNAKNAKKSKKK